MTGDFICQSAATFVQDYKFDYIIVGGGTAGVALAVRLTENPLVNVGVIEAGQYLPDDPLVTTPGYSERMLCDPKYDWAFLTVPQPNLNGRQVYHSKGKMLGGSSGTNFMAWCRANKEEYDAVEALGNKGWNCEEWFKYMRKSETAWPESASDNTTRYTATLDNAAHGQDGPVSKSFPTWRSDLQVPMFDALDSLGVKWNPDAGNGNNLGASTAPESVDPRTGQRSYSVNAYLEPVSSRKNLVVLTDARVSKITLGDKASLIPTPGQTQTDPRPNLVATGVEFVKEDQTWRVNASQEVILSAGALQTPQLLELSGIGSKDLLERHGIPVQVDLPADHVSVLSFFEVDPSLKTLDIIRDPELAAEQAEIYKQSKKGLYASSLTGCAFVPLKTIMSNEEIVNLVKKMDEDVAGMSSVPGIKKSLEIQKQWLADERHAHVEIVNYPGFFQQPGNAPEPGKRYNAFLTALTHPVSRGSVHIASGSVTDSPTIDPRYLSSSVDLDILVASLRFIRKLNTETSALGPLTKACIQPGQNWDMAEGESDETKAIENYAKSIFSAFWHTVGTASMMKREDGGVVDENLLVYGTNNLRVVDASILPIHLACNPMSAVYAIAEKAADIIKAARA